MNETPDHGHDETESSTGTDVGRRRLLATVGATVLAGVAGCSELSHHEFEAATVALPDAAREDVGIAETARDSRTIQRDGPAGSSVEITNKATVYSREAWLDGGEDRGPLGTVLGRLVHTVNGGRIGDGAVAVPGEDIATMHGTKGGGERTMDFLEGAPTVAAEEWGLIVPSGTRSNDLGKTVADGQTMIESEKTLAFLRGELPGDEVTYTGDDPGLLVPDGVAPWPYATGSNTSENGPDRDAGSRVFIQNMRALPGSQRNALCDGDAECRTVEPGEAFETTDTVFAIPGATLLPGSMWDPRELFDAGVGLSLEEASLGIAALSTPNAEVNGESANPLVDEETGQLLRRDVARRMLARTGLKTTEIEWLAGPEPASGTDADAAEATLLGTEAPMETFHGVVSSDAGPWGVAVAVVRATEGDHVAAAGVKRRPVGTPEGGLQRLQSASAPNSKFAPNSIFAPNSRFLPAVEEFQRE